MTKLKARLDKAVAEDLGIALSCDSITLKEVAEHPNLVTAIVLAYLVGDDIYYDQIPVWRYVNGMRTKIPKFHSRPVIEARLAKQLYNRYYVIFAGALIHLKVSKPSDLKLRLPFTIGEDGTYRSTVVVPDSVMGLRKKPLLFHRRQVKYELQN